MYHFKVKTTTENGGMVACKPEPVSFAPLKDCGLIFSGCWILLWSCTLAELSTRPITEPVCRP